MFIPLGTDQRSKRRPVVTESLILINMLVYLVGLAGSTFGWFDIGDFINAGRFDGRDFHWWQLATYQFLHDPGGIWHLAFNMLFLWVFGCAVEDRLKRIGFLAFYLFAGAVAAIVHWQAGGSGGGGPIIGASGSIAGITGAFLAFFPRSHIRVLVFFFFIGVWQIPALWFIALYFLVDVLRATAEWLGASGDYVAYQAHLAGYLYGFLFAFMLLAVKLVPRGEFDVFRLFQLAQRRKALRGVTKRHGTLFDASLNPDAKVTGRAAAAGKPLTARQQAVAESRAEVALLLREHQLADAATRYATLLDEEGEMVFSDDRQLDLANQLYAEKDYAHASRAYELLLKHYPRSAKADEVKLILSLIYARHMRKPQRARDLLAEARPRIRVEGLKALADQLLAELDAEPAT